MKDFLKSLANHNIDYFVANLDKFNFGERDLLVKMIARVFLRKLQTALKSKDFSMKEFLSNLNLPTV
jgi:hypothetical protein